MNSALEAHHHPRRLRHVLRRVGVYPIVAARYGIPSPGVADGQAAEARPRPQGRRAPRAARADRRCAAARDRAARWSGCARRCTTREHHRSTSIDARRPDAVPGRRRAAGAGRGVPARPPTRCRRTSIASSGVNGTYTFTMKPNVAGEPARGGGRAGAPDDRAARQRARRRRAEHRAAGRQRRSDPRAAARRDRRRAREGDHPVDRPARAEDRRAGPGRRRARRCSSTARCRPAWRSSRASRRAGRCRRRTVYYLVRKVAAVTGQDLRNARPSLDENNRPAVSFTLNTDGAAQVRQGDRREHRPPAGDRPRRPRAVGAAHRTAHHDRRPDHRQLHAGGSRRTCR